MSKNAKSKTARERLTSLLGDFPQGFNAGMLAGIPGWAGDIGYLLQEYPRALLTDTPLRPPVEYAGTTDSIAKAAGYEIPGTLSGQLGAAVGGLLSPGPGDLAAFAKLPAMFLGVKAATANQDALTLAKTLEKAGATRDEIWKATGELGQPWMKGPDGEWRFEISDKGAEVFDPAPPSASELAKLRHGANVYDLPADQAAALRDEARAGSQEFWGLPFDKQLEVSWPIRDKVSHPELFAAHPSLEGIRVAPMHGMSVGGLFDASDNVLRYGGGAQVGGYDNPTKSVALHELMHAVQEREGFARGGSPGEFASGPMFSRKAIELASDLSQYLTGGLGSKPAEIVAAVKYGDPTELATIVNRHGFESVDDALRFLSAEDVKRTPFGQYERLAGEAEARNVQSRMNMSLQDRINTPPWMTLDIPEDQLIVRKGLLGQAMSEPPSKGMLGYDTDMKVPAKPYQPIRASEVDGVAETLVSRLKELGIVPEGVNGSSTSTGRSVYIPITVRPSAAAEPNWRRDGRIPDYVWNTEIRVSDHGTGAQRTGNYLHVNSQEDVEDVIAKIQHQVAGLNDKVLQAQKSIDLTPNRAARRASQKAARGLLNP